MKKRRFSGGIATSSIALTFVQCVTMCTGIVQTMILSRTLSKLQYGTYSEGTFVVSFISPFLLLGLSNAISYFGGQKDIDKKKYIETLFGLITLLGILGMCGILLAKNFVISYFENPLLAGVLVFVAIRPLCMNLITAYQTYFVVNNMALWVAGRNLIISITQVIIVIIGAVVCNNIVVVFAMLVAMDVLQILVFRVCIYRKGNSFKLFRIETGILKQVIRYAVPLGISTMVGTLSIYMDKMLIGRMMSTEDFALYSNMSKELPFSFVVNSFTTVVTPVLVKLKSWNKKKALLYLWRTYLEFGYTTTWIICGGAIVFSRELIEFLYSSKYTGGYWIFLVYLLVAAVRFTYFGSVMVAYGKTKWIMCFSVITLGMNVILNFILFEILGMIGPAIASFVTIFLMGLLQLVVSCRILECKVFEVIKPRKVVLLICEIVVLGGGIRVLVDLLMNEYIVKLILGGGMYLCAMALIKGHSIMRLIKEMNGGECIEDT